MATPVYLAVDDPNAMTLNDQWIYDRLVSLGYDIQTVGGNTTPTKDRPLICTNDLHTGATIGAYFKDSAYGVIVQNRHGTQNDDLGICFSAQGTTNGGPDIFIANGSHILAAGFATSSIYNMFSTNTSKDCMPTVAIGPGADLVVENENTRGQWVSFGYETGAELIDGTLAAGPRAFFGLRDGTESLLTAEGLALWDAAIAFIAPHPPVANAGSDASIAAGGSIQLNGTGSSPGTPGNTLSYLWSSPTGTFNNASSSQPIFTGGGTQAAHTITLTVTELETGSTDQDNVIITEAAPEPQPAEGPSAYVLQNVTLIPVYTSKAPVNTAPTGFPYTFPIEL